MINEGHVAGVVATGEEGAQLDAGLLPGRTWATLLSFVGAQSLARFRRADVTWWRREMPGRSILSTLVLLEECSMSGLTYVTRGVVAVALSLVAVTASAQAVADTQKPFEPVSGQAGKDVVWVPTPQATVDKMLDLGKVTPQDYVIDLGSGNGVTVITAAKRGATALGVEFNPEMVKLARRLASEAGVADKATFVEGDLFEADPVAGHRDHAVPAPRHQRKVASEAAGPQAGHAHRVELVRHGRLAA